MTKVVTLYYPFTSLECKHRQCYQDHHNFLFLSLFFSSISKVFFLCVCFVLWGGGGVSF